MILIVFWLVFSLDVCIWFIICLLGFIGGFGWYRCLFSYAILIVCFYCVIVLGDCVFGTFYD